MEIVPWAWSQIKHALSYPARAFMSKSTDLHVQGPRMISLFMLSLERKEALMFPPEECAFSSRTPKVNV